MAFWAAALPIIKAVAPAILGGLASGLGGSGDSASTTQTTTFQPPPRTAEQARLAGTFSSLLYGAHPAGSSQPLTGANPPMSGDPNSLAALLQEYPAVVSAPGFNQAMGGLVPAAGATTPQVSGYIESPGMRAMLGEDEAHKKLADEEAYGTIEEAILTHLARNQGFLDDWQGQVDPMLDRNRNILSANDRARAMNAPLANRAPVNLSMGGFNTPFTTGTQRNAQDYGIRLVDQSGRVQNQSARFLEDILGQQQLQSGTQRQSEISLADMLNQIQQAHTPNVADMQFFDLINALQGKAEDRRYQTPTQTVTNIADAGSPSFMDSINTFTGGAEAGQDLVDLITSMFSNKEPVFEQPQVV